MEETKILNRARILITIATFIGIVALGMSVIKNVVTERWLKQKSQVSCIPADVDFSQPIVYHQTAANPVNADALLKTFAEQYIHKTEDEQIVDYHAVTENHRYDNARVSGARFEAINMSVGTEKLLNEKRYHDSNEVFYTLQKGNMGWIFLIDDILVFNIPGSGATLIVVRGEFQVTFDKVKVDLPPKLWGYREIHLMVEQGVPTQNLDNSEANKYGLYVAWSNVNTLTPEQKENLSLRNYDYYLTKENHP